LTTSLKAVAVVELLTMEAVAVHLFQVAVVPPFLGVR